VIRSNGGDQVKGCEVENGQYVVLEPDEVAAAVPESDKTLKIEAFLILPVHAIILKL